MFCAIRRPKEQYFDKSQEAKPSKPSASKEAAQRLWEASRRLVDAAIK